MQAGQHPKCQRDGALSAKAKPSELSICPDSHRLWYLLLKSEGLTMFQKQLNTFSDYAKYIFKLMWFLNVLGLHEYKHKHSKRQDL